MNTDNYDNVYNSMIDEKISQSAGIYVFLIIICFIMFSVSPVVMYYIGILVMLNMSGGINNKERYIISIFVVVSGAIIISSRVYFEVIYDDFIRYYDTYKQFCNSKYDSLYDYSSGAEPGFPVLMLILSLISKNIRPEGMLLFFSLLSYMLYYIWIEKYVLHDIIERHKSMCVSVSLLFFSLYLSTQLCRQMLAMILLLYLFTINKKHYKVILAVMAIITHSTSIIFILVWILVKKYSYFGFFVALILSIISFYLYGYVEKYYRVIDNMSSYYLVSKTSYYLNAGQQNIDYAVLIMITYVGINIIKKIIKNKNELNDFEKYSLYYIFVYYIYIGIPQASLRFSLMFSGILFGYILYHSVLKSKKYITVYAFALSMFIIYKFYRNINQLPDYPFRLWDSYDWIGYPLYFIGSYMQ